MSIRTYLGELEELVLMFVAMHDREAYAVVIVDDLKRYARRNLSISAVHAVLHRLEEKGFVESSVGGATAERGGRRKRLFAVTAYGIASLKELQETRNVIWQLIKNTSLT